MKILTGGRQSGQNLYSALKLYNYINSLPNDTIVRVLKKDGICALCVDKSISKEKIKDKIKDKIKELNSRIEKYREYVEQGIETDVEWVDNVADRETVKVLQELLEESE